MPETENMEDASMRNGDIPNILALAYRKFSEGELEGGIRELERGFEIDFEHQEVVFALKCAQYWKDRFDTSRTLEGAFERAESLISQWKAFPTFYKKLGAFSEMCTSSFKRLVFQTCLGLYEGLFNAHTGSKDADLFLRIGRCHKALGSYDMGLKYLSAANGMKREESEILGELADCYALVNEMQLSKVFFREAFFLNPQGVDLAFLESEMILRLVSKVEELGYSPPYLAEWVPVYGVLFGVFNVKRELRSIEYGKLRQGIYTMEMELREHPEKKDSLVPRLLNRYFWLIDHYLSIQEEKSKIDEVLLKIKHIHPSIYEQYTK